jgi:hypothetical protein
MSNKEYRINRARFTPEELAPYEGCWVAFSLDGSKIIAGNADWEALERAIVAAGEDPSQVSLELIESEGCFLGGGELQ